MEFERIIFHVDMDSFYASCELSDRPELKGEPFVVGADPREGKGRGVVLACNYPAKKLGLRSGMPISKAWELCPKATYVRPNFSLYSEISGKAMELIRPFADITEQVSIDEAYLDVSKRISKLLEGKPDQRNMQSNAIKQLATSIKMTISENLKITCSVGVANSKIIAKIATDMSKPDGLTIVRPRDVEEFLSPLSVSKIPGVGKVTQRILSEKFRVEKISDLRKIPLEDLKAVFGKSALWLLNIANGLDDSEVVESWDPVSISGETTFDEDESDYNKVRDVMLEVAKDVHQRVVSDKYFFKNAGIKIRFTGFETHTRSKSMNAYTDSLEALNRESERLLSEFYDSGKKVRLIGVRVSSLLKKEDQQKTLLDWEQA